MGSHELGLSQPNLALFAHASTKCLGSVGAWSHQHQFAVTNLFKARSLLLKIDFIFANVIVLLDLLLAWSLFNTLSFFFPLLDINDCSVQTTV